MTDYIVSFPNLDPELAKQHACIVSISVGGDAHEGKQFQATLKAINDSRFKKCYIMVAGKLQRHTEQIANPNLSTNQATELAINKELEWKKRNTSAFSELAIEYEVIFWDHWLTHQDYQEKYRIIEELYISNEGFQTAVDKAATQFNSTFAKQERVKVFKGQQAQCLSEAYIKEESAVILLWRTLLDVRYIIYPIKNSAAHNFIFDCLKLVSNGLVSETNSLEFVTVVTKEVKDEKEKKKNDKALSLAVIQGGQEQNENGESSAFRPFYKQHVKASSPPKLFADLVKSIMESNVPEERAVKVLVGVTLKFSDLPLSPNDQKNDRQANVSIS